MLVGTSAKAQIVAETPGELAASRIAPPAPGQPIANRARPEYDPTGQHIGSFLVFPSLTTTLGYDDNIFAQPKNTSGDGLGYIAPQIVAASDWGRHELDAIVTGRIERYFSTESENIEAGEARLHGRLDIDRDDQIELAPFYRHDADKRDAAETRNVGPRPLFDDYGATASYKKSFDELSSTTTIYAHDLTYETVQDKDQQRQNMVATERVAYAFSPRLTGYVESQYDVQHYDLDSFGRDSNTWTNLVGAAFDIDTIFVGDFGIGVLQEKFRDPSVSDTVGLALNGKVTWNPTELSSLILTAQRSENPTRLTVANLGLASNLQTSSRIDTVVSLEGQHELRHDILLRAVLTYETDDYASFNLGTQDIETASVIGRYFVNRYLSFDANYTFATRSALSSQATVTTATGFNLNGFTENVFLLSATAQF